MAHHASHRASLLACFGVLAVAIVLSLPMAAGASPATAGDYKFRQTVPVNLVFIGYPRQMISQGALIKALPATYTPVVRDSQYYGLPGRNMGLKFGFTYRMTFAGPGLEGSFFKYLTAIGTPGGFRCEPSAAQA